jgi:hypothetical protein
MPPLVVNPGPPDGFVAAGPSSGREPSAAPAAPGRMDRQAGRISPPKTNWRATMRFGVAAAALAALTLAAPAAAQENAVDVMRGVMQQLAANTEGVQDYTLTLRAGPMSTSVYVHRDGDEWEVESPSDEQMGEMLQGLVVWPMFGAMAGEFPEAGEVSDEELAEFADIFNLTRETLDGRPAHAIFLHMEELLDEDSEMPDSMRIYVDPSTRQIMRVQVAGVAAEMEDLAPGGGEMEVVMDFRDYRETDGLTVPRRLRMDLRVEMEISDEQRQMMQVGIQAARAELAQDDSEEGRQAAAMIDMFIGLLTDGHMAVDVEVEDVQVNTGPPAWFDN